MNGNDDFWYEALLARDPRFDGRFFVAVKTTGIYCRPVCPAPKPRRRNCLYVPSAAAAEQAGFRPCRRCRPETAPGSAAWRGVETTIARALRLIEDGALDKGSVDDLAGRLGIGERYLRRLFTRHLGASPIAIAQTQRLHLAKRLIDTTDLPMTDVAAAAGFNSLRRFNDAFAKSFHCPPSAFRDGQVRTPSVNEDGGWLPIVLPCRPPFDWTHMVDFLGERAIEGVETVDAGAYARTFRTAHGAGILRVRGGRSKRHLEAELLLPHLEDLRPLIETMRAAFDLDADSETIDRHLGRDALFRAQVRARPGIRLGRAWDLFEYGARAIIGQQISVKGARTIAGRIAARLGTPLPKGVRGQAAGLSRLFPEAEQVAKGDLAGLGMTNTRIATLRAFGEGCASGALSDLDILPLEAALGRLTDLPGIGPWTAQMIAMKALGHRDVFPATDLGVLKALGFDLSAQGRKDLDARAERWRPWRAYAAMRLWTFLGEDRPPADHAPGRRRATPSRDRENPRARSARAEAAFKEEMP